MTSPPPSSSSSSFSACCRPTSSSTSTSTSMSTIDNPSISPTPTPTPTLPLPQNPTPSPPSFRSFHGRTLPAGLPALSSVEGTARFARALSAGMAAPFFSLVSGTSMQTSPALCGPASLAGVLNALRVDPRRVWVHPWRWYVDELLLRLCCSSGGRGEGLSSGDDNDDDESVLEVYVKKHGVTLDQLHCIAQCEVTATTSTTGGGNNGYGNSNKNGRVTVSVHRDMSENDARHLLIDSVSSSSEEEEQQAKTIIIAAYDRRALGQTGSGHFSPVAAYDAHTDAVLVLDTASFKYEAHWVPVSALVKATAVVDKTCGRTRGFLRVSVDDGVGGEGEGRMREEKKMRNMYGGTGCEACKDVMLGNNNKRVWQHLDERLACC